MAKMWRGRLPNGVDSVVWRGMIVVDDRLGEKDALVAWQAGLDANKRVDDERLNE